MRAYAETLMDASARFTPNIKMELVELAPEQSRHAWKRRWQIFTLPAGAWAQRKRKPDLWHVLDGSRAFVLSSLGPTPSVVTVHDIIPWLQSEGRFAGAPRLGSAAKGLWRFNGRAFRAASAVVCVSEATRRDLARSFGVSEARSSVVHLPLRPDMATFLALPAQVSRAAGVVLHVGNNAFYKNRAGVLRVFSSINAELAMRLIMAGPAPDPSLLMLAGELGISDRIEWLANPADEALASAYRRATVLLFPSLYEGFGWPVLEAMAFGLPIVASDTPAVAEVVGGAATCLPAEDEPALAAELARLLASEQAAADAARRGLARAESFRTSQFATQTGEAYRRAISNGGAR